MSRPSSRSTRTADTWVFGYGSLASPASVARTIGRSASGPHQRAVAHLAGFGRRWNYGSMHLRGDWAHEGRVVRRGLVVSLGLTLAEEESCNGVAIRVSDEELARLDRRERDYERTDVTERIELEVDGPKPRVVTYVPRASAIDRYERARDEGRAAVRRSYWELVHAAFDALGSDHLDRLATTPRPDVPVVDISITTGPDLSQPATSDGGPAPL